MSDAAAVLPEVDTGSDPRADQRVVIYGVSWEQYEAVLGIFEDRPGLRITYLEGALELMTPSRSHEVRKKMIGRLLEAWAVATRTPLFAYGSTTFRRRAMERGAEFDECYTLERALEDDSSDVPDLVIEVAWTRGGLDKLAVYSGLGVPELWLWRRGRFTVYRLRGSAYEPAKRSELLPALDLAALTRLVERPDQTEAVIEFVETVAG